MHRASIPLTGANENPPEHLALRDLGDCVKRLKLNALIARDALPACDVLIRSFLKQVRLELLPRFFEKMPYLFRHENRVNKTP